MGLTDQQKRERAAKVHALGLRASDALREVIAEFMALGENDLARALSPAQVMLRAPIAQRVNELEGFVPKRRPRIDNSEHLHELRGGYASRPGLARVLPNVRRTLPRKPVKPLTLVPRSKGLPDAG